MHKLNQPRLIRFKFQLALSLLLLAGIVGCGSSAPPPNPADFGLSLSAQSTFIPIGFSSASLQVSIQPVNGLNQPVTVSFSGLPAGVTTSPASPFQVSPGSSQMVTLNAASTVSAGVQAVTVTGVSGILTHTQALTVSVAKPSYVYVGLVDKVQPVYSLLGYAMDANTGSLTALPGAGVMLPAAPLNIATVVEPAHTFLFVLVRGGTVPAPHHTLLTFGIDPSTGSLTQIGSIDYGADTSPDGLVTDPKGQFLYVSRYQNCAVAYLIDPASGNLTQASCSGSGDTAGDMVLLPPGDFAYSNFTDNNLVTHWSTYSVNRHDGSLQSLENISGSDGGQLFVDPQGRAFYSIVFAPGIIGGCQFSVESITINSRDPRVSAAAMALAVGDLNAAPMIALDPAGNFAFVPNPAGGGRCGPGENISGFDLDPKTGMFSSSVVGSPSDPNIQPVWIAVEPTQARFVTALLNSNTLSLVTYPFDAKIPMLTFTPAGSTTFPANSTASSFVVVSPQ